MLVWDVGHLYSLLGCESFSTNSSYKEDTQKKYWVVIIKVKLNFLCFNFVMYKLELWYNVQKRFPPKLISWFSGKETRIPSCLFRTYTPIKEEMKLVFDKFDSDKDGMISRCDLRQLLPSLKENMGDKVHKIGEMVAAADFDGDGFINFKDFMQLHENGISELDIRSAFRMYDLHGKGKISADDLQEVLHRLGENCSNVVCKRIVEQVDADGDGLVGMEDFLFMMTKTLTVNN